MNKLITLPLYAILLIVTPVMAQWQTPQFTRLSTNEGLSQSHVNAILKDRNGFMWFATDEGLNKYDGYKFSIYKHYPEVGTSISDNFIYDILEDRSGIVWVATAQGLDKFDREKDLFIHFVRGLNIQDIMQDSKGRLWLGTTAGLGIFNPESRSILLYNHNGNSINSLSDNNVTKLTEDKQGNLWIATQHGLNKFNPITKQFDRYYHDAKNPASISSNLVKTVFKDSRNAIWAGMVGGGISRYNSIKNRFDNFLHNQKDTTSIGHNDVLSIMEDATGNIWAGTENGGISVYHPRQNGFTTFGYDVQDDKSLSNNSVYCLYRDDIGNIWVGTYSGGVNFLPAFGNKFTLYRNIINRNSLSNNIVLAIEGDSDGYIWLGTDGGGLNKFDPKTRQFSVYRHKPTVLNSPKSDFIITVIRTGRHKIALGYHRNGFDLFASKTGTFTHYFPVGNNQNSLPITSVNALYSDKKNNIWIGTWAHGLYNYDNVSKQAVQFVHDVNDPRTICNNSVNAIFEDKEGRIWLGTESGLDRFDADKRVFTHFVHNPKDKNSISSNTVNCLLSDGTNYLWVGTTGGLCRLNKTTGQFTTLSEKDGLPNDVISALVRDAAGNLWMSTNKGIARFNPKTKAIRSYDISDGLQGNEFKVGSVYQAPDQLLYFGGTNGFNTFYPDSIQDNTFIPPVYLTDFQVFNKSVRVGNVNSPLISHISTSKMITLTHDQDVFSVEFAALNYTLSQKNQYAYKLEGFDKDWNYVGHKRTATYTNLDPGDYVFKVKGSNNDGIWNEKPVAVTIRILPPYWVTWWFRLLAISLLSGSAYVFYQSRINAVKAQKWALEQIVEERTERLHQEQVLNKMKSQFVSTASHEFRTPLATIQSSIDLVDMYLDFPSDNGKPLIQKHLRIVEKEIGKFGDLLDDVLTIEKMNAGKVSFFPRPVDFPAIYVDLITTHFQARKDQRTVEVLTCGQPRPVLLDEKLIRHVLVNLLSNAFKFSTTNPQIQITFEDTLLLIAVSDRGIGIPANDLPHLFETFFRAENVATIQGTGLGLFIAKQAVERHGGSIQVQSQVDVGTTFTVTLPI